jgi:hypothetical protein
MRFDWMSFRQVNYHKNKYPVTYIPKYRQGQYPHGSKGEALALHMSLNDCKALFNFWIHMIAVQEHTCRFTSIEGFCESTSLAV